MEEEKAEEKIIEEEPATIEIGESGDVAIERRSNKKIALGTILGYVSLVLSVVSGFLFTPWIISSIGSSGHGVYTLSTSLVNIFLLDFGLSATANTFLARYRAKNDIEGERNFLGVLYKIYLAIDFFILIAFTVVYFLIPYIYQGLTAEETSQLKNVFLITGTYSLIAFPTTVFSGIISAYEEFVWAKILDIAQRILYITLTTLAITLGWGLYGLVASNCLSALIIVGAKYLLIRGKLKAKSNFKWKAPPGFFKQVFAFSGWAMACSIAYRFIWLFGPTVLGVVSDSGNISAFGIVSSLESYFYMLGNVMSGLLIPKVARMVNDKTKTQLEIDAFIAKVVKTQVTILFLAVVGFIAVGNDFITVWLSRTGKTGAEYSTVYLSTCLAIIPYLFVITYMIYQNEMYIKNQIKYIAIAECSKAILNVGLMFLLGYFWGSLGACISIAISTVLEVVLKTYFIKKKLGAHIWFFIKKAYVPLLIPAAIALVIGLLIHFLLPVSALWKLIIGASAMIVVYLPLCYFLSYSKDERKGLLGFFRRNR